MKMLQSINSRKGLASALTAIAVVAVVGLLASFLVMGGAAQTVTTTSVTTVPTTVTTGGQSTSTLSNVTVTSGQLNAEQIYATANESLVTLQGTQVQTSYFGNQVASILGSGFVIDYSGTYYVITNDHVISSTSNLTATFSDGDAYPAKVVGSDPYSDLAVVSIPTAPKSEFIPLTLSSSSGLRVGDSVVAIGNPYGLTGSMTEGIVSQLGRTIQDETAGNYSKIGRASCRERV